MSGSGGVEIEGQIVAILQCKSIRELSFPITGTYHACHGGREG